MSQQPPAGPPEGWEPPPGNQGPPPPPVGHRPPPGWGPPPSQQPSGDQPTTPLPPPPQGQPPTGWGPPNSPPTGSEVPARSDPKPPFYRRGWFPLLTFLLGAVVGAGSAGGQSEPRVETRTITQVSVQEIPTFKASCSDYTKLADIAACRAAQEQRDAAVTTTTKPKPKPTTTTQPKPKVRVLFERNGNGITEKTVTSRGDIKVIWRNKSSDGVFQLWADSDGDGVADDFIANTQEAGSDTWESGPGTYRFTVNATGRWYVKIIDQG
jgi:hypothetical protein